MLARDKFVETGTWAAISCMLLDQIHKFTMLEVFKFESVEKMEVTGFFNLVMVWNRGISFGMFQDMEYSNYFFMGLTLIIVSILFLLTKTAKNIYEAMAYGMIIGGALGNLADRVRVGAVADFFDFYYKDYHWPSFNVADSCVFLGAVILVALALFKKEKK